MNVSLQKKKTPPAGLFVMPPPSPLGSTAPTQGGYAGFEGSGQAGQTPSQPESTNQLFGSSGFGGRSTTTPHFGQQPPASSTTPSSIFDQGLPTTQVNPLFGPPPTTAAEPKPGLFSQVSSSRNTNLYSKIQAIKRYNSITQPSKISFHHRVVRLMVLPRWEGEEV